MASVLAAALLSVGSSGHYASEIGENNMCLKHYGPGTYPLPCTAPRDEWDFAYKDEFVITAWWPPTMNAIDDYAAAHFNMVLGGNMVQGCIQNGTTPDPATATEAADCVFQQLPKLEKLGLKFVFGLGNYPRQNGTAARVIGGAASEGGITETGPQGYPTTPEIAWVVAELARRNLSHVVAQYFLHDDDADTSGAVEANVRWLKAHAPHITPQTNTFPDANPEMLYQTRQFVFAPEEYSITGRTGNASNAAAMAQAELSHFANNQMLAERYRLDAWPLFGLGDGGGVAVIESDSLVRVQVYGALAYGSRGLYYYCWGHGIWNVSGADANADARGAPGPNYPFVKASNADARVFGTRLLPARHVGAIGSPTISVKSAVAPAPGLAVEAIAGNVLVGVFSDGPTSDAGYLMVVRFDVSMSIGGVAPATVELTIAAECSGNISFVEGGKDGFAAELADARTVRGEHDRAGGRDVVKMLLHGGGGALIRVQGVGCGQVLRAARSWWYNPRSIDLRHSYPETSLKSATYSAWNKQTRKLPGGIAGDESNFVIGGSKWEHGGFGSASEARDWANAGFLVASLPASNFTHLAEALEWALPLGLFVMATAQPAVAGVTAADVTRLADQLSCHPNYAGFVLGGEASTIETIARTAAAMRSVAYWEIPVVLSSASVARVKAVAHAGVGLAPMELPAMPTSTVVVPGAASAWAKKAVDALAALAEASNNGSVPMTMAVAVNPCGTDSDSMLRFTVYMSVVYGAQALWWEGVGACAPIGSAKFELVAAINNRVAMWADPLFLKSSNRYTVLDAWSTSSVALPPLLSGGVAVLFTPPGSHRIGELPLVVSMSPDMIALRMNSTKSGDPPYLLFISTVLSPTPGGAGVRDVEIQLSPELGFTQPIESDPSQGIASTCGMHRLGSKLPLRLAGGGAQLVAFEIEPANKVANRAAGPRP